MPSSPVHRGEVTRDRAHFLAGEVTLVLIPLSHRGQSLCSFCSEDWQCPGSVLPHPKDVAFSFLPPPLFGLVVFFPLFFLFFSLLMFSPWVLTLHGGGCNRLFPVAVPYSSEGRGKGETSLRNPSWALCASCRLSGPSAVGEALPMAQPHPVSGTAVPTTCQWPTRDKMNSHSFFWAEKEAAPGRRACSALCPSLLHRVTYHILQPWGCHSPWVS